MASCKFATGRSLRATMTVGSVQKPPRWRKSVCGLNASFLNSAPDEDIDAELSSSV